MTLPLVLVILWNINLFRLNCSHYAVLRREHSWDVVLGILSVGSA